MKRTVRSIFSKIHTPEVINEIRLTFKHYFLCQLTESQKPKSSTMNSNYEMVIRISIHSQHFISFRVRTPKKKKKPQCSGFWNGSNVSYGNVS